MLSFREFTAAPSPPLPGFLVEDVRDVRDVLKVYKGTEDIPVQFELYLRHLSATVLPDYGLDRKRYNHLRDKATYGAEDEEGVAEMAKKAKGPDANFWAIVRAAVSIQRWDAAAAVSYNFKCMQTGGVTQ